MGAERVITADRQLVALPGTVTETALILPDGLPREDWERIGERLRLAEGGVQWWVGDWMKYGEESFSLTYQQAAEATGYSNGTLRNCAWVSETFPLSRRHDDCSWSHHMEVASLEPDLADALLITAAREGLTRNELRAEVQRFKNAVGEMPSEETCSTASLEALIRRGVKYGTVYADPPWPYDNQGTRAATGDHYGTMSLQDIADLPIADLAADDAHLHFWTTNAFLFDSKAIMEAWGFTYKSCFIWVKPEMGLGNYWRLSHEFLLFGVRGKAPFRDRSLKSWTECSRGAHSAKPDQIRQMIEKASPGPYLELFGRRIAEGWTVWGNQISRTMFDASVPDLTEMKDPTPSMLAAALSASDGTPCSLF